MHAYNFMKDTSSFLASEADNKTVSVVRIQIKTEEPIDIGNTKTFEDAQTTSYTPSDQSVSCPESVSKCIRQRTLYVRKLRRYQRMLLFNRMMEAKIKYFHCKLRLMKFDDTRSFRKQCN